jgi:hypothetical protein
MNRHAGLLLAGATFVGGAAIGKAAVDHLMTPKDDPSRVMPAAKLPRDPLSILIAVAGMAYTIYSAPAMWESWKNFDPESILE